MAQSIILKRSALQGKVPTTSSLSLGELAVNTYDGKIYLNRSGSIQSIQEIVTTNVVNTGSITLTKTGSFGELVVSQDGNFQRDLYVTRDIITNGSLDILYDVSASVFLGAIRATNGVISGSSQITSLGFISASQTMNTSSLATTGSNSFNGDQTITGSVTISGTITANEFHTTFVSSSVLYTSGSTKFGNTGDDIMSVTGSLIVSGSQTITGSVNITGSLTTFGNSFYRVSASNAPFMRIGVNAGLYPALTAFDSSGQNKSQWINSNGTMYFDYDGVGGGNLNFRRQIDGESNTVARFVGSGNLLLQNVGTYTDNGHKVQINASGSQGALYVSGSTMMTGSLVVTNGITGSLFGTASFALNGSSNAIMYQTASAASVWTFNHFLATQYPVVTVYDNTNSVIIPQSITTIDSSSLTITFSSARTGVAVASKGGYVGSAVGTATVANALSTVRLINGTSFDGTQNITIPNLVSGSTQISLAGTSDYGSLFGGIASATSSLNTFTSSINGWSGSLATTGSNTFRGNQTITGSLLITGSILQNGGGLALQDNTILYHFERWFTPTSTVSTSGTTVTSVGTQFTSGMVNAKLAISGESRLITAFTSNTQVTVDSAYSQNYSAITASNWGVYSRSYIAKESGSIYYNTTRLLDRLGQSLIEVSDNIIRFKYLGDSTLNSVSMDSTGFQLGGTRKIVWTNNVSGVNEVGGTNDLGLRRNTGSLLEIYNGVTNDGALSNRADLLVRNITGSNAFFSGSLNVLGTISATQYNVGIVSSSILYTSGSNKFGDTQDDTHQFTGSVSVTGSVTATSFTGSLFGTASFALNGSSNAIMYQTASAASVWTFNHFLATPYPVVTVYDNTNSVIIPQSITSVDSSSLTITFSSARTGVAVASKGGYVGSAVGTATVANALSTVRLINGTSFDGTQNITIPNLVSGSTQISLAGTSDYASLFTGIASATASLNAFTSSTAALISLNTFTSSINAWSASIATTGSNTFIGNETISGSLIVNGRTTLSGSLSLSPSQSAFLVSHSISQSTTVGATVYGVNITPLFTNVTSSQTQTALRVMPTFTGSFSGSNTANIIADFGATSVGSQFTITDVVSGSIYMVNDVSGLPIIEALSDGQVNMYDFPYKAFNKSGSYLSLGVNLTPSSSVTVQSDFIVNKGYGLYSRTTQASGSTVSNVTSSLFNLVFSNTSSSVFMSAVVTGYDTGSRQTVTGDIKSTIKYNAGVASVVGYNQKFINSEVANVNFDILASSVSASLLVYGSGSTTYKWGATITYQVI